MNKSLIKKTVGSFVIILLAISGYTYFKISSHKSLRENECFEKIAIALDKTSSPELIFKKDFGSLQLLVEYSLVARAEMLEISNRIVIDKNEPLANRDLVILKSSTETYLEIREELYGIANRFECALDVEPETWWLTALIPNFNLRV